MRILITGGAGFIGSNLAAYYLKLNHQVTIYDNFSRANVDLNIKWLETINKSNLTIIRDDIRNIDGLKLAIKDKDVVFHEAAQTAVTTSLINPSEDFDINARGTFNVVEAARLVNPSAVLFYASTNKVYGSLSDLTLKEEATRYEPIGDIKGASETRGLDFHSPYGCSKGAADQYMFDYARSFGLKTVVFRQSCIYGEHQYGVEDQGWVAFFALRSAANQPLTIYGDGKQVRDLLFIDDLVDAYDKALNLINVVSGQAFNMGGGYSNRASLLEIIDQLNLLSGKNLLLNYSEPRVGDQKYYVSDITKAKQILNWEPKIGVKEGVERLYNWIKAN